MTPETRSNDGGVFQFEAKLAFGQLGSRSSVRALVQNTLHADTLVGNVKKERLVCLARIVPSRFHSYTSREVGKAARRQRCEIVMLHTSHYDGGI